MEKLFKTHPQAEIARIVKKTRQAVNAWKEIPPHFVKDIAAATGIPKEQLIPDLFS